MERLKRFKLELMKDLVLLCKLSHLSSMKPCICCCCTVMLRCLHLTWITVFNCNIEFHVTEGAKYEVKVRGKGKVLSICVNQILSIWCRKPLHLILLFSGVL